MREMIQSQFGQAGGITFNRIAGERGLRGPGAVGATEAGTTAFTRALNRLDTRTASELTFYGGDDLSKSIRQSAVKALGRNMREELRRLAAGGDPGAARLLKMSDTELDRAAEQAFNTGGGLMQARGLGTYADWVQSLRAPGVAETTRDTEVTSFLQNALGGVLSTSPMQRLFGAVQRAGYGTEDKSTLDIGRDVIMGYLNLKTPEGISDEMAAGVARQLEGLGVDEYRSLLRRRVDIQDAGRDTTAIDKQLGEMEELLRGRFSDIHKYIETSGVLEDIRKRRKDTLEDDAKRAGTDGAAAGGITLNVNEIRLTGVRDIKISGGTGGMTGAATPDTTSVDGAGGK
jgi:hypothetical protein